MNIHYEITEEYMQPEETAYTAYGILLRDTSTGIIIHTLNDISLDRDELQKLIDLCNTYSLSPEHLEDIVQDFLSV